MLTLSRKVDEAILIGDGIRIVVKRIEGGMVKLGIEAPRQVPIYREEVFAKIGEQNREALALAKLATSGGSETALKWPHPAPAPKPEGSRS